VQQRFYSSMLRQYATQTLAFQQASPTHTYAYAT